MVVGPKQLAIWELIKPAVLGMARAVLEVSVASCKRVERTQSFLDIRLILID